MGDPKPKINEVEGGENYPGFAHFGVTVVGFSEDGFTGGTKEWAIFPSDCSILRFRCNACQAVFDVEPKSRIDGIRKIPLCPHQCNFDLLEKWVEEQKQRREA